MDETERDVDSAQSDRLFAIIRDLKAQGILASFYISHRLGRDSLHGGSRDRVARWPAGRDARLGEVNAGRDRGMEVEKLEQEFPKTKHGPQGKSVCGVQPCFARTKGFADVSFSIRGGEVLGLTG